MLVLVVLTFFMMLWLCLRADFIQAIRELWSRYQFAQTLPGPGFFSIVNNATAESKFHYNTIYKQCLYVYIFIIIFLAFKKKTCLEAINWFANLSEEYGPVHRVWFALELTVFVTDPDYIKVCNFSFL